MAFGETAALVATLDLKGNFASSLKRNQSALGSFSGALARTGKGVGQVGAGLARVGAIAATVAVGGIVAAGKAAIDFQDAFAGVRKTVDEADLTAVGLSFDKLALSFRKMATEIPIAATEFARIGEAAGALGVKAQDIESFTKTVALLGVTTNLTTDTAAQDLGKLGTILQLTAQGYTDLADTLVNLGNQGASTESEIIEITKRFAAQGKQAGLTTNQILALASSAASLGVEPEAGGSALSRIFSNMGTEIALDTKKADNFARVTAGIFDDFSKAGDRGFLKETAKEITRLQGSIEKGQGLPEFIKFLTELGKLGKLDAARALKGAGITNVRDRNAILLMSQNIAEVNRQLEVAEDSTGALGREAAKRFDTIASKLTVLKQNFIEAGIIIGEGFLPALGRAAEKLTAFLQVDANRTALKAFGEDIGKALDGIDWNAVLAGAKTFYGVLKTIFDLVNSLPTEIKAAAAAFLVLNKASGGLIGAGVGNIAGGLAGAAITGTAARTPGIGRLFAQPVFVTNFPLGFGGPGGVVGGGSAVGKIASAASKVFIVGAAIGVFAELKGILDDQTRANREQIVSLSGQTGAFAETSTVAELTNAIKGITETQADLNSGLAPQELAFQMNIDGVRTAIEDQKTILQTKLSELITAQGLPGDTRSELSGIRMAIAAAKPPTTNVAVTVNVTAAQVTKSVTIQKRFGPSGGSRERGPTEFN